MIDILVQQLPGVRATALAIFPTLTPSWGRIVQAEDPMRFIGIQHLYLDTDRGGVAVMGSSRGCGLVS